MARSLRDAPLCISPRSKERGPVEAYRRVGGEDSRARPLRARKSAAPLKLALGGHRIAALALSPRSKERGPVEARRPEAAKVEVATSPRSKERGPVEAAPASDAVIAAQSLSALERA